MNIEINVKTHATLDFNELYRELKKTDVLVDLFHAEGNESCTFGDSLNCIQYVAVVKGHEAYSVEIGNFATDADLKRFANISKLVLQLTRGELIYEVDQKMMGLIRDDIYEWIDSQMEDTIRSACREIMNTGKPVYFPTPTMPIVFGPFLAEAWDIDLLNPGLSEYRWMLTKLARNRESLYKMNPVNRTEVFVDPIEGGSFSGCSFSEITLRNRKVEPFDYIPASDFLSFCDEDAGESFMVPAESLFRFFSPDDFSFVDDAHWVVKKSFSAAQFREYSSRARAYAVPSMDYNPLLPGHGYDAEQKTCVLMWNPEISSVKKDRHRNSIPRIFTDDFDWSVAEYEKFTMGDRFVMICCGGESRGLVMSGILSSHPRLGPNWRGSGRPVRYMDLSPNFIADPNAAPIITTEELQAAIPSFNWSGGHSGRLLTDEQARRLEKLLSAYLCSIYSKVDGITLMAHSAVGEVTC